MPGLPELPKLGAAQLRAAERGGVDGPVLVFDDADGRIVDLDLRGSEAEVLGRIAARGAAERVILARGADGSVMAGPDNPMA